MKIMMVCLGNICRSPTAEGVLRRKLALAGLGHVEVASAGTAAFHQGDPPDPRSISHAAKRGYDLRSLRAAQVCAEDFEAYDLLLAMDEKNLAELRKIAPPALAHKAALLMNYAPHMGSRIVPDPYYGGAADFEQTLDFVEASCAGLVKHLQAGA